MGSEQRRYLSGLREAATFCLGKNNVAIDADLKDAAATGNQPGFLAGALSYLSRHTDGVGLEVSHAAILDGDIHDT